MASANVSIVDEESLRRCVSFDDALSAVRSGFRAYSSKQVNIVASVLQLDRGDVHVKGAHLRGGRHFVVKAASWISQPGQNDGVSGGAQLVCSNEDGKPVALLVDHHFLSDLRTAAAGAIAIELLARPTSNSIGVVGAGSQARLQLEAGLSVLPSVATATIFARRHERAQRLAAELEPSFSDVEFRVAESVEALVKGSDVIVTATNSRKPIVRGEWLRPGQHITAVGADDDTKAELDEYCLLAADQIFVDSVAQTCGIAEIGAALRGGRLSSDRISGEIGQLLDGSLSGRTQAEDITLAKLTGIGALDLALAEVALDRIGIAETI